MSHRSPDADVEAAISTVRTFSRAVTLRVGTFTDRFLGRDRPLAEARLIFEVGADGADVRGLRTRLGLDSGYLSRLLRSLERQGLVAVVPSAGDRRIRQVGLTDEGRRELAELNRRGDDFATSVLRPLSPSQRARLVTAMNEVERLLDLSFTAIAVEDPASHEARWCLEQYFAELATRFPDGFDEHRSLPVDSNDLRPPHGVFLLARLDGAPVGCGTVKSMGNGIGWIKRMWVASALRGLGVGRRLLEALEHEASELGLSVLRLDTNRTLDEAQKLYRRNGYREVAAFNDEPYADFWFEKQLAPRPPEEGR